MGKDKDGKFHPQKGMPSGANKEEGTGIVPTPIEKMEEYDRITEKYMEGENTVAQNVNMRHPNRNTSKGEESKEE